MSHKLENNFKGALGEEFIKRELADFELLRPVGIVNDLYHDDAVDTDGLRTLNDDYIDRTLDELEDKGLLDEIIYTDEDGIEGYDCYEAISINIFGGHTTGSPDFLVKDTRIFIEVKTGSSARLEDNQKKEFPKILENDYRIFVIKPMLSINKRKFEIIGYDCYELHRCKENKFGMKRERKTIKEIKDILANADNSYSTAR